MGAPSLPSLGLLLLLLRGIFAAPAQGKLPCKDLEGRFYDEGSQSCCHRCPEGSTAKTKCPTDPQRDCMKQCPPGQFLNNGYATPRCEDCLSCNPERDLVQKTPCTHNSSGVCECQPGLYCHTRIPNTCARCFPLTTCKPGFGVRIRGTSDQDTVCEECPLGTFSEVDSSTEPCMPRAVSPLVSFPTRTKSEKETEEKANSMQDVLGVVPPLAQLATAVGPTSSPGTLLIGLASSNDLDMTSEQPVNESSFRGLPSIKTPEGSSKEEERDLTSLAAALLLACLLLAVFVALWKKRAFRKWIVPHVVKESSQAKISSIGTLPSAEKGPEETDLTAPEYFPESSSGSLMETEETPDPEEAELLQVDGGVLVEPGVRSHTSNCIEKIYIMKAETVILGSVLEGPTGKTCPARGEGGTCGTQEQAEGLDVDMHYPEQETEFSPGSDITTPVEEEWEFPCSILANEKPLESQEESSGGSS